MSETVTRQRQSIDLDDFERRLQAHTQRQHEDDPLAELARIVGEQPDPYDDVFAQPQAAEFRPSFDPHRRQEPSLGGPRPRLSADFAAIEAGLRGAPLTASPNGHQPVHQAYDAPLPDPRAAEADHGPAAGYGLDPDAPDTQEGSWVDPTRARTQRGTRRPVYAMAASIAVAVIGIGIAFAYKGTGSSPREIKTIMAAAGPTKIQPPAEQGADQAAQDPDSLGQQPAPTKLVSREEQPVDLSQAVQDNAARDAASHGTDAASVPVPLSPAQAAGAAYPDYTVLGGGATKGGTTPDGQSNGSASAADDNQGFGVGMPKPKRVKSVAVRPDGTILNDEASAPAPAGSDTTASDNPAPATTPRPAAPTPKVVNRAASVRATAAARPADGDAVADDGADVPAQPTKPAKPAKKAKPARVATAETGVQDVPSDAADEAKPAGTGAFAVQLAAPGSEADARSTTSRLLKKYGGALHGRRLGFHRAESNGHTVFRVRVSSLTREDATSLCGKVKAEGGTCFVAKD